MFTVPMFRVAVDSMHPCEFATGAQSPAGTCPFWTRSTKVLLGRLAAAATFAMMAAPSDGVVPFR